jgi:aminoglycoside phosphotransferase (APT) family kinase protein
MRLLAEGRASEVFDLGDGRVLRRFKSGGDPEREALVMRHARERDYPVPAVLEVGADSPVLEKIDGPTMWEAGVSDPATIPGHAAVLAELHRALHRIDAPEGLSAIGEGTSLLHLDFHPFNVILSPSGPVVVDWTNARAGAPVFDVALTWVIGATTVGGGPLVRDFVRHYLVHFDREELRSELRAAAEYRTADANVTDEERAAIRALVASEGI